LAEGEHLFHTLNGSITLTLPADARFRVDAQSGLGKVASQFVVTGMTAKKRDFLQDTLRGSVGDNPATGINLRTGIGSIEIQKEK
jgi:hypothetical protein